MTTTTNITRKEYEAAFAGKEQEAYRQALDIRKFEIELYWKRASYFWTFIGATFVAFFVAQGSISDSKTDLSVFLSCIGIVFSFGWYCVNKGSKYWQENWEKHVDNLENCVTGPLFKIELTRNNEYTKYEKFNNLITGPAQLSVSKINILISLYVIILWVFFLFYSVPEFNSSAPINWYYVVAIGLSFISCTTFIWQGKSHKDGLFHVATLRQSRIKPDNKSSKSTTIDSIN